MPNLLGVATITVHILFWPNWLLGLLSCQSATWLLLGVGDQVTWTVIISPLLFIIAVLCWWSPAMSCVYRSFSFSSVWSITSLVLWSPAHPLCTGCNGSWWGLAGSTWVPLFELRSLEPHKDERKDATLPGSMEVSTSFFVKDALSHFILHTLAVSFFQRCRCGDYCIVFEDIDS